MSIRGVSNVVSNGMSIRGVSNGMSNVVSDCSV